MENICEAGRSRTDIKDKRVLDIIDWCIDVYKRMFPGYDYDGLEFKENTSWSYLGRYNLPKSADGNGIIEMNSFAYDGSDDEEMKSTVLHELGHYVDTMNKINDGTYYFMGGNWRCRRGEYKPHGSSWHRIVDRVARDTGISIERTGNVEFKDHNGQSKQQNAKYILKCDKCGYEWEYQRMSNAVKNPGEYTHNGCGGHLTRVK